MGRSTILTAGILALAAVVSAREPARAQTPGRGPKVRPVAAPPADRQVVLDGNAAFALDVYGQLRAAPGNFMFSPLSLSAALAMATAGADGVTRDQMASASTRRSSPCSPTCARRSAATRSSASRTRSGPRSSFRFDRTT